MNNGMDKLMMASEQPANNGRERMMGVGSLNR